VRPVSRDQRDELPRGGRVDGVAQFGDDRPAGTRPSSALAVVEKPAGAKVAIHGRSQLRQIARAATDDQPHLPLNVIVTIDRATTTSLSSSTVTPAISASIGTSDRTRPDLPGIVAAASAC
jgi:hypothetical protein